MSEIVVTQSSSNQVLRCAVGDTVVVRLPENPTTGYRWQFEVPTGLELAGDDFNTSASNPGAGGERVMRFCVRAGASIRLHAALRRSWETGVAPQAEFAVVLEVH